MLRDQGWTAQVVEKWNPHGKVRIDLFGCIDLVAMRDGHKGLLGIQATTTGHIPDRVDKALLEPRLQTWLATGNRFQVVGWALRGARGKRKLWTVKIREILEGDPEGYLVLDPGERVDGEEA